MYYRSFFVLLAFVLPITTHANTFTPPLWKENQEVTAVGSDLEGDVPVERLLCFAPDSFPDDLKCFRPDSPSIKQWIKGTVRFVPAANTPPSGILKIFISVNEEACIDQGAGGKYCDKVKKQKELNFGPYKAHPYIVELVEKESGIRSSTLVRGKTYEIRGVRFGDEIQDIYVGGRKIPRSSILEWSYKSVTFRASEDFPDGENIQVNNGVARSNAYPITIIDNVSDDPFSHLQLHLLFHKVIDAWKVSKGEGVVVAIIDSGIDTNHREFAGRIWENAREIRGNQKDDDGNGYVDDINGWNFVSDSAELTPLSQHGTAVAGVVGAAANNTIGVAGIAPDAVLMSLIVSGPDGRIKGEAVSKAIRYAVDHGANIINLSMGGPGFTTDFTSAFTADIRYAASHNVLTVIAAGNGDIAGQSIGDAHGVNLDQNPKSPVCNRDDPRWSIGVAALNPTGLKSSFSDFGSDCIDLAAIGENVVTTTFYADNPDRVEYVSANGTSFAAPMVSGIAALVWSMNPKLAAWQVRDILISSGDRLPDATIGRKVNAVAAVDRAKKTQPQEPLKISSFETPPAVAPRAMAGKQDDTVIFPDVSADYPHAPAIAWAKESGVVQGYPDGYFRPRRSVNRAEFLKILMESQGIDVSNEIDSTGFPDIDESAWYAPYLRYAKRMGIIEGYPDGFFRPDQTVNAAEALKMAYRTLGIETIDTGGEWYQRYRVHAEYNDVLFDTEMRMDLGMAREDTVWVMWRLITDVLIRQ
ncbi:S8 family serine peptidase [Candidatus Peregrinibacteria bacterium]|nr:S8 family serine peptidase [Candidatus Peregrinibacteria bacterium]